MQAYLNEIEEVIRSGRYKDNWESLQQYEVPKWFKDCKFGIFIHWGVFSVPAFGNEWYPRTMYRQGSPEYEHHIKTYGSHKDFGYKDFIPMFRGENFDAGRWTKLFKESGAKYIVPVAEHHDGFQMYKSEISHWNAYEMGPQKDILGELNQAAAESDLVFGVSSHRIEHWFFMGEGKEFDSDIKDPTDRNALYWPAMSLPPTSDDNQNLFSEPYPTKEFLEDWLVRTCEIIDNYRPKILWFDWWIEHDAAKPYIQKLAAYYYNRAGEWGEEVVISYKYDAFAFGTAVLDIERGQFADTKPYFWQTDTSMSLNSWSYTENNSFRPAEDLICDLADIVSKNGCLLLNVGPKPDGTICDEERDCLLTIGKWLKTNGEAIYGSSVWRSYGEGPTQVIEGGFSDAIKKQFTSADIRYTVNGGKLYAIVLKCSEGGHYDFRLLASRNPEKTACFHGIIESVEILGFESTPEWERSEEALHVHVENVESQYPIVFRIELK